MMKLAPAGVPTQSPSGTAIAAAIAIAMNETCTCSHTRCGMHPRPTSASFATSHCRPSRNPFTCPPLSRPRAGPRCGQPLETEQEHVGGERERHGEDHAHHQRRPEEGVQAGRIDFAKHAARSGPRSSITSPIDETVAMRARPR